MMLAATRVLSRVQAHGITLVPDGVRYYAWLRLVCYQQRDGF